MTRAECWKSPSADNNLVGIASISAAERPKITAAVEHPASEVMRDFPRLYGGWAVVAGASEGLGAAFATELAKRGMHLLLIARRTDVLRTVADKLRQDHGIEVRFVTLDLARAGLAEALSNAAINLELGVIVYNAAFVPVASFLELEDDALDQLMRVYVQGPVTFLRALQPSMRKRGRHPVVPDVVTGGYAGLSSSRRPCRQQGIQHRPRRKSLARVA